MSVKKLINSPEKCVDECLYGLSRSYPRLVLCDEPRIVFDRVPNEKQVAILSGGGSGHEPFPSGFVGCGMLSASISGAVFTSPPHGLIVKAIRELSERHKEIFIVVPNYSGDVLNFGLALETVRRDGIQVESITVGDDIALQGFRHEIKSGRRGMCGLILVLKVAGYLAKMGENLSKIKNITEVVSENIASIGVTLESCSLPGSGLLFHLGESEMELGVGVHGEAGIEKISLKSAKETVQIILSPIINHLNIKEGDEVVGLVNNLGALSQMEQWIIAGELEKQLSESHIKLSRLYAGALFTSLNMAGFQICLWKLIPEIKTLLLNALDDVTDAPAWPGSALSIPGNEPCNFRMMATQKPKNAPLHILTEAEARMVERCLKEVSEQLIKNEERINYLDSGCGDGDCGTTLSRLSKQILKSIKDKILTLSNPGQMLRELGDIAQEVMGGTSGAVYGLFLAGASSELSKHNSGNDPRVWGEAWLAGLNLIKKYSAARVGDRTLIDSLEPGCLTFQNSLAELGPHCAKKAFNIAVQSAIQGSTQTQNMKAAIGRASYVKDWQVKKVDAGAFAVTIWLKALENVLCGSSL